MKKLDVKVVWLFFIRSIIRSLFFIVFLFVWLTLFSSKDFIIEPSYNSIALIIMMIIIWLALCYIWAQLSYNYYFYELTDLGFKKESGVITKKYTTIPYDRIQNIDINRGLVSRILGISDLLIQTAGSSAVVSRYGSTGTMAEGYLPGLSEKVAEKLRDELIIRVKQSKNQGL